MLIAQALSSDGKRTRAQIWLRRAADTAPDDGTRRLAARDFRYVRARNPLAMQFRFNVSPSSNINNGSARETTQLYGLPFEFQLSGAAQALKGVEYSTGVSTRYRFSEGQNHAHDLIAQFSHRTYTMTAAAKAQAPGVSGRDFAFSQAALGYVFHRRPERGLGPYSLNATLGHSWYGGVDYFSYLRLGGSQTMPLGERTVLTLSASGERQFGASSPDADILRTDLRLAQQIGKLGRLTLSLGHSASSSATDISDYSEQRAGAEFSLARPVLGAQVSFGIDWRQRDYPRSRYDPSGRADREVSASLDMVFTKIERFGFHPTMSVTAARTESNIGLYDSEQLGVSFGIRSAF